MRRYSIYFFLLLISLCACDTIKGELKAPIRITKKDHKLFYVADHRVDCVGEGNFRCLQVKEQPEDAWGLFYGPIIGFEYEEGYEYLIEVSIRKIDNPPADGSSQEVSLVKIWAKEKT